MAATNTPTPTPQNLYKFTGETQENPKNDFTYKNAYGNGAYFAYMPA